LRKLKDWSRFAADYEARSAYVVGKDDLDKIGEKLAEQKNLGKLLELGCGPGIFTVILAAQSDAVTATDISVDMVNAAAVRLCHRPRVVVEQADCFNLLYPADSFDTVIMANLLHVVGEPQKALKEARRVLKTDGRIIIASLTTQGMRFFDKIRMGIRYIIAWGKPPGSGTIFNVSELSRMLETCGFSVLEAALIGERSKSVFVVGRKW